MCGQYFFDFFMAKRISILLDLDIGSAGLIRPTDPAPYLFYEHDVLKTGTASFGYRVQSLIINGRAETLTEKYLFRDALKHPVIIPASEYYEYNPRKQKYTFRREDNEPLYMAGFLIDGSFVIITTAANSSVQPVHDRMPLILEEDEMKRWLKGDATLLKKVPGRLQATTSFEQTSLF